MVSNSGHSESWNCILSKKNSIKIYLFHNGEFKFIRKKNTIGLKKSTSALTFLSFFKRCIRVVWDTQYGLSTNVYHRMFNQKLDSRLNIHIDRIIVGAIREIVCYSQGNRKPHYPQTMYSDRRWILNQYSTRFSIETSQFAVYPSITTSSCMKYVNFTLLGNVKIYTKYVDEHLTLMPLGW